MSVVMSYVCRCDPGGEMKRAASGVQEIAGAMWGTHDVPPSIVLSEIELRERREEEGHRRPDTCERHRWI